MPRWSSIASQTGEPCPRKDILSSTQIYVLCIPSRKQHATELMAKWGFPDAQLVDGPVKNEIDMQELITAGVVLRDYLDVLWQDVEYFPEGKVACHLGHLDILKKFLMQDTKSFALVFEDDLEPGPESLQQDLQQFLTSVPEDFDLLHLGFVRESRDAREPVKSDGSVFRSVEALGRHAYLVTRRVAELLVQHTLPMYNHGDKMFQEVYQRFQLRAYQPPEPLFFQDRIHFESELTERWKPSRAFQPTPEHDEIRDSDRPEMLRRLQRQDKKQSSSWPRSNTALFLNIDGVVNSLESPSDSSKCGRPDPHALAKLAKIMKLTGCCLVLTSPWRLDERYCGRLASALVRSGVSWATQAVAATPDGRGHAANQTEQRILEIGAWLEEHPWLQGWVVVDCLDLMAVDPTIRHQFVKTDTSIGLLDSHVEEVLAVLKSRATEPM
ncbi:unnamed protein product [Durusdinium trenchii]|uniref:Uncharacterized protein n=2 Tax=Durusdinium trenchii TaxID=1381693 RepID=A0ABP0Q6P3_9DINO